MTVKLKSLLPKRPNRWLIRLSLLIVACMAFLLWMQFKGWSQNVTVQNLYGKPIPSLKVTIGEETRTFQDVAAGTEVAVPFRSRSDSLRVEVKFADGTLRTYSGTAARSDNGEPANLVILPTGEIGPRKSGK
jgi:hypothetical protein